MLAKCSDMREADVLATDPLSRLESLDLGDIENVSEAGDENEWLHQTMDDRQLTDVFRDGRP